MEYFKTSNYQLAMALAAAGCKLAPQIDPDTQEASGGPAINLYTLAFLRARKIGVGKRIDDAVQEAVDRKIIGTVSYLFVRDAVFDRCIAAWDQLVAEMQQSEHDRRDPEIPDIDEETVMRVCFVRALNKKAMDEEVPWLTTPLISTVSSTTKEEPIPGKPGPKTITEGKGKIWSLGLSKEARKRLKI